MEQPKKIGDSLPIEQLKKISDSPLIQTYQEDREEEETEISDNEEKKEIDQDEWIVEQFKKISDSPLI